MLIKVIKTATLESWQSIPRTAVGTIFFSESMVRLVIARKKNNKKQIVQYRV